MFVGSADADVVEPAVVAEGDGACFVDAVVADSEVDISTVVFGGCFGQPVVDGGWVRNATTGCCWKKRSWRTNDALRFLKSTPVKKPNPTNPSKVSTPTLRRRERWEYSPVC